MMKKIILCTMLCAISIGSVWAQNAKPTPQMIQKSYAAEYEKAVEAAMLKGDFEGMRCGGVGNIQQFDGKGQTPEYMGPCSINVGYGSNSWLPSSSPGTQNADPLCDVPALPTPGCGKMRVPISIVIFENSAWTGSNYIDGSNFLQLTNTDVDAKLTFLNTYYANSNIEFYEVRRLRVNSPDLYDYYSPFLSTADPTTGGNDGVNDEAQTIAYDLPNVINIYFVGGFAGDHDCCGTMGYAPYPPSRDYTVMRYGAAISGTTLDHELGHYFGLAHTQALNMTGGGDVVSTPAGALNNSDALTTGDRIADTWPDPNFSYTPVSTTCNGGVDAFPYISNAGTRCTFDNVGYNCVNGSNLTIDPNTGTDITATKSTILAQNIMSYNLYGGCRVRFSPCQYRKVYEDLQSDCRKALCYTDPSMDFTETTVNTTNSPYKEICVGETPPTFVANKGTCHNWYAVATGGVAIATNTNTFTPTAGTAAGQLNNTTPGTYYYYVTDVNTYNTDCRRRIEVKVLPKPGTASTSNGATTAGSSCIVGSSNANFGITTNTPQLGNDNNVVGWWFTEGQPACNLYTTPTAITTAITAASKFTPPYATTPIALPNAIYQATGATSNAITLNVNCGSLNANSNYYLTPITAKVKAALPNVVCNNIAASSTGGANFNTFPGRISTLNAGVLTAANCSGTPYNPINAPTTFTLAVTISGYTGTANAMQLYIETLSGVQIYYSNTLPGSGTYNFTQADFPSGFDPNSGFKVWMSGPGNSSSSSSITLDLDVIYPGLPAIPFPTTDLKAGAASCVDCIFGQPLCIRCDANLPALPVSMLAFTGKQQSTNVQLLWQTADELNSSYFAVEKSTNGAEFMPIDKVQAAGNSNDIRKYTALDSRPALGKNYYRLKQVDTDGKYEYSNTIVINYLGEREILILPNPNNGAFDIKFANIYAEKSIIKVYDAVGKQVYETTADAAATTLTANLTYLPQGTYQVQILQGKRVFNTKFVKID